MLCCYCIRTVGNFIVKQFFNTSLFTFWMFVWLCNDIGLILVCIVAECHTFVHGNKLFLEQVVFSFYCLSSPPTLTTYCQSYSINEY